MFYAVYQAGVAKAGSNSFTPIHGLQSIGVTTRFNLDQAFEIGQIEIYENIENIPDVEVTAEKLLDGDPLIYHLATNGATSATLAGRSNKKCTVAISYFTDTQDAASGTPLSQCVISGLFPSALNYNIPVDGNMTESVTLVGNNKEWKTSSFTFNGAFDNTDTPPHTIQRRQHVIFGTGVGGCSLPSVIPGISSNKNAFDSVNDEYAAHIQSIRISTNLGRDALYELGRRGPYHRVVNFPVEVRCDIEIYCQTGDKVTALESSTSNLSNEPIVIYLDDGTVFDLGSSNKLQNSTETGGNAGARGGNRTCTYSFVNFNRLTVTQPNDPSGL